MIILTDPNVRKNHMPTHEAASVSIVEESVEQEMIKKLEDIQTHIDVVGAQLRKHGLFPANHVDDEACAPGTKTDENLKKCIQ